MRLTEEDMQERRATMIWAAFHLFCESGIENSSMKTIAQKAHVGENTLYRYFNNKETLVLEVFVKLWDIIMHNVEQIAEDVPNYNELTGCEQIRVWMEGFRCLYQEYREFVLFSYEAKLYLLRHHVKLERSHQDIQMQSFRGPCLAALDKGKADGSIRAKESSEDLFYALWGSIRGYIVKIVIYEELCGEEESPWKSRYDVMERGMLHALSSE